MKIFNNIKTDSELNNESIDKITGLSYYNDFISSDEEEYLLEYLSNIEYKVSKGKIIKYYGYNYTPKTNICDIKDKIDDIPKELDIIFNKIGVKYNQLVIEKIPVGKSYSHTTHSKIFEDNIITLSIGSNCVSKFESILTNETSEILIKRRSIIVLSKPFNVEWLYRISRNKQHRFNTKKIKMKDRYSLSFKNIKFRNKSDDSDIYYFSY